ncbi:type II toxin-antitoxin system toxin DNA ADP-ribosyl transferase DarT [Vibrio rotiferianus]|uniref:type II toxin-antitoxin system toxin DNA ADP-ribosyl transferase DarT n=1 Tax=Vibrio rotiferianus TaxID=190895 RepID=UPI00406A72B6
MPVPAQPKIYHIVHVDRLASILGSNGLLCDAQIIAQQAAGTTIGMNTIKQRRLTELTLDSHPDLYVGQCVPFYFCPRSIMLYVIHRADSDELAYKGGQGPIIHLQADLNATVQWAQQQGHRWAFTLSNAGSYYFEDRSDLAQLHELDWPAIYARQWQGCKEGKQAEFLIEQSFPWHLVEEITVQSPLIYQQVVNTLQMAAHRPPVTINPNWYY